jgi:hypothetical protein
MPAAARSLLRVAVSALALLAAPRAAEAFCGFYVAQADAKLFNQASQVVLVRDGERTVITMSNDFKGELTDFALVVPVPAVLKREQIHVGDRKHLEHLDAYSSPRLVEYFDGDPCEENRPMEDLVQRSPRPTSAAAPGMSEAREKSLGVTVEAQYTVGEYDIVILSAKQSDGLETWLRESGYKVPARSAAALKPYIKQDMKFFVARVNLKNQRASGFQYLRPLAMAFESKIRQLLQGPLREGPRAGRPPRAAHRVLLGHGLVRPMRGRPAVTRGAQGAGRVLAR